MRSSWRIDWINWPVHSQFTSRRNAQHAMVVCAQRRREREETEAFLAQRSRPDDAEVAGPAARALPRRAAAPAGGVSGGRAVRW